ncbi:MAG TPA: fumarylacetoacetate hydrolase family protein [Accumulibacter sp.]|jgi:fumarylpyruvate hydrolase|uniref:Fumarylacetoacetate hydrolase family protein n=2 Tax=Candidatus Accumulibacter TaxID=327159 RepID=A0A080M7K6_9PROT|nr:MULTISPECIES: fumarylacetoacetate hydrolase family protein [Candidatus Accumulibacter]KFB77267.1 MAG: Fumarylpyruvate hydrolase [Candidatus Accumulibacter cognatus]MBL8402307.1 fumarylacetoacetate hydrolase family protein [Accumulibacter sp.]MBN8518049.1 fumarylacetoacetate hydrolase family protein [Accumulibacter sp.]MBO3710468.1 fumarylacetoacetate hydrolase family protein [Accumulibacter sp.]MCC2867086.1 fumarylacetoacetate hydrolase family protein [Candidatus Accumulibacter phosphatis]
MNYVFPPPPPASVPVAGGNTLFPVRRVYCVGRNYADHAAEMGADRREPPFFFSKPADTLVQGGGEVAYPPATDNLQHEVELVVALAAGGANIDPAQALDCVYGYAVGLDLTRRDLQLLAKNKGHPWDMGKGFDQSAPITAIHPLATVGHPARGSIWLKVNGQLRQNGDLEQMSWKVAEVIANLSTYVILAAGDLIFTGTPAGVSTVRRGDVLEAGVAGVDEICVRLI